MAIIFGASDGSELLFRFTPLTLVGLRLESHVREHFHLSMIEVRTPNGWVRLSHSTVQSARLSSELSPNPGETVKRFLSDTPVHFETKVEKSPWFSAIFNEPLDVSAIRVHNRIDGLWGRARELSIFGVSNVEGAEREVLILDTANPTHVGLYFSQRLEDVIKVAAQLEKDVAVSRLGFDLFRQLVSLTTLDFGPGKGERLARTLDQLSNRLDLFLLQGRMTSERHADGIQAYLSLILLRKHIQPYGIKLIVQETLARLILKGRQTAFARLKHNPHDLLNNELYGAINTLLKDERVESVAGKLVMYGHGIFVRNIRLPEVETLKLSLLIQQTLAQLGLRSYIAYGALLGLVREQHLLDHDDDVDILAILPNRASLEEARYVERLTELFKEKNLRVNLNYTNSPRTVFLHVSDVKNPIYADIFFGWPSDENPGQIMLPMQQVSYGRMANGVLEPGAPTTVHGVELIFPNNCTEFLQQRYGSGWKTPDYLFRLKEG